MSTPFSRFCDQVVRLVRWFPARGAIAAELAAHLEDHAAALMERGVPEEEAAQQAVAAMGDPEALGRQLNRAHPPLLHLSVVVTSMLVFLLIASGALALLRWAWDEREYARLENRVVSSEISRLEPITPMAARVEVDGLTLRFRGVSLYPSEGQPSGFGVWFTCSPADGWLPDNSSTRLEMDFVENVPGNIFYRFVTDTGWTDIPYSSHNHNTDRFLYSTGLPPADAEHLWLEGDVFGHTFRVEIPILEGGVET